MGETKLKVSWSMFKHLTAAVGSVIKILHFQRRRITSLEKAVGLSIEKEKVKPPTIH